MHTGLNVIHLQCLEDGHTHLQRTFPMLVNAEHVCEGFFPSGTDVASRAMCAQHYNLTLNSLIKIHVY